MGPDHTNRVLRRLAGDTGGEPCERALAIALLAVVDVAQGLRSDLRLISYVRGAEGFDAACVLSIGSKIFYVAMTRTLSSRSARTQATLRVAFTRNSAVLRLVSDGTLLHEGDPSWDDPTLGWPIDEYDLLDPEAIRVLGRRLGRILLDCGYWHSLNMGGEMLACDLCPNRTSCHTTPQYLIRKV